MSHAISLALCLSLSSLAFASQMGERTPVRLTVDQDLIFDQVYYDEPGDGQLWARGRTYKASFGAEGATYIPFLGSESPRNMPVKLRLASATLGGQNIELEPTANWHRDGDTVTLDRGAVAVQYHLGMDSIEQTFVLDRLQNAGDLHVRIDVETDLNLGNRDQGFRFSGEHGGVNYGAATVLDARGRSLLVESRIEDGSIAITVPDTFLREAALPVVVDPLITTFTLHDDVPLTFSGDVAYDATTRSYAHAIALIYSGEDHDILTYTTTSEGVIVPGLVSWTDITDVSWSSPSIANSNAADNYLVVATVGPYAMTNVLGRLRDVLSVVQGPPIQISPGGLGRCGQPSVGGDLTEGGSSNYCVAFVHYPEDTEWHIESVLVSSSGSTSGGWSALDHTYQALNTAPHVSKSNGSGGSGERRWNIVWERWDGPDKDILGAQINTVGGVITPIFSVDNTSAIQSSPQASPPLDSASGGLRDFLVVYEEEQGTHTDIVGRMFKGSDYQYSFNITELEADVIGSSHVELGQYNPTIGTDGSQFIVAYQEDGGIAGSNIFASTLRHQGQELVATEAHTEIADNDYALMFPMLATAHDGGSLNSRRMSVSFLAVHPDLTGNQAQAAIYDSPDNWDNVGDTVCAGMPNTTGSAATFRAFGSSDPDDNRLVLDVDNLPPFQYGHFLMSASHQVIPLHSGFLCLGGPQIRLHSTLASSWIRGSVGAELDLMNLPEGATVQAGQTWYFQFWYRDGGSSNFSNAEAVTFD